MKTDQTAETDLRGYICLNGLLLNRAIRLSMRGVCFFDTWQLAVLSVHVGWFDLGADTCTCQSECQKKNKKNNASHTHTYAHAHTQNICLNRLSKWWMYVLFKFSALLTRGTIFVISVDISVHQAPFGQGSALKVKNLREQVLS